MPRPAGRGLAYFALELTVNRCRIALWFDAVGLAVQSLRIRRNESPGLAGWR
jgi:hypothetical protein